MRRAWSWVPVLIVMASCSDGGDPADDPDAMIDAAVIDTPLDSPIVPIDARAIDAPTDAPTDAAAVNPGFVLPTAITKANVKTAGIWTEVGDADWSCLGTPSGDQAPAGTIALSGLVSDFQTDDPVGAAVINAFAITAPATSLGTATTSNVAATRGTYTMTVQPLSAGVRRYGFSITATGYLKTYLLHRYLTPGAAQTANFTGLSASTANALPAFVGISRDPAKALMIGSMVDCQGRAVSNAVATASVSPTTVNQPAGMNTFYFSAGSTSLPVRHNQAPVMNRDGLFVVLDVPPLVEVYLQVWGFRTTTELASGTMTLLAEVRGLTEANAAIYAELTPRRAP